MPPFGDIEITAPKGSNDNGSITDNFLKVFLARVYDVVLSEDDGAKMFSSNGRVEILIQDDPADQLAGESSRTYALPINMYNYTLPTINESIVVVQLEDKKYYYFSIPPVNIVTPERLELEELNNEYKPDEPLEENLKVNLNSYESFQIDDEGGNPVYGTNFTPEFVEATDGVLARSLHEGDTILQGRYGQSIKFTSRNELNETPWSLDGEDGQPVISIRCGQSQVEDPTTDNSFIYLLSDQSFDYGEIEFSPENSNVSDTMDVYAGSQVIIGSDRLTFISKADDISISSKSLVNISTAKWAVDFDVLMDQVKALSEQVAALTKGEATFTTGVGPTGPATNAGDVATIVQEISGMEQ